jgi:hypothetical protein
MKWHDPYQGGCTFVEKLHQVIIFTWISPHAPNVLQNEKIKMEKMNKNERQTKNRVSW